MLFIVLYKVVVILESVDKIIQMKPIAWSFPVVLFTNAFEGGSNFASNESYWAVLSCDAVYYAVQDASKFWV